MSVQNPFIRCIRSVGVTAALFGALAVPSAFAQYSGSLNLSLPTGFRAVAPSNPLQPWLAPRVVGMVTQNANDSLGFALGFRLSNNVALVSQLTESNRTRNLFSRVAAQRNLAYGLDLVGTLPVFDKFALIASAGLSRERNDPFSSALGFDPHRTSSAARLALGLQYEINAGLGFSIGIERRRHFGNAFGANEVDSDSVLFGARIRF